MANKRFSCIYFVTMDTGTGYRAHKIGVASQVGHEKKRDSLCGAETRMASLQIGNPFPLELVGCLPSEYLAGALGMKNVFESEDSLRASAFYAEGALHAYLGSENVRGEWFSGPKTEEIIKAATTTKPRRDFHTIDLVAGLVTGRTRKQATNLAEIGFVKQQIMDCTASNLQNS